MLHLKVTGPDFLERTLKLPRPFKDISIGNHSTAQWVVKSQSDHLLRADLSEASDGGIWLTCHEFSLAFRLYDIPTTRVQLLPGILLEWGATRLEVLTPSPQKAVSNATPEGSEYWKTRSTRGYQVLEQLKRYAPTDKPLLLEGPSGVGKELLAKLAHQWSPHSAGPFVPINCGAISPHLVESELFGHMRGAFTGAINARSGALLKANNGTLFLDEVGDLPYELQVKLLRFLDSGEIKPVGSDSARKSNARIICASHKNLAELVAEKKFRADLFYRISALFLNVPPLSERPEDIIYLAQNAIELRGRHLSLNALRYLTQKSWPGNVRELKNALERALLMASDSSTPLCKVHFNFLEQPKTLEVSSLHLKEMEKKHLWLALERTRGNRARAARLLGIGRSTLFEMLKRYESRKEVSPLSV